MRCFDSDMMTKADKTSDERVVGEDQKACDSTGRGSVCRCRCRCNVKASLFQTKRVRLLLLTFQAVM
jgi:hypothetical protein